MSVIELDGVSGRAVAVDRSCVVEPLVGAAVPGAIGQWLVDRVGVGGVAGVTVQGRLVTLELSECVDGSLTARGLALEEVAPRGDTRVWVGSVFGCKVVVFQRVTGVGGA